MSASAPRPSTGTGRIHLDADHMREDHLAELVLQPISSLTTRMICPRPPRHRRHSGQSEHSVPRR